MKAGEKVAAGGIHDESGKRGGGRVNGGAVIAVRRTRDNKCEIGDFSPLVLSLVNSLERAMIPNIVEYRKSIRKSKL
jgi:hypothetical protein